MATDSTELTFVRCRSCGRLVPATATRCRECEAPLEGVGRTEDGEKESPSRSRVRQNTVATTGSDFMDVVSRVRDDAPPEAAAESPAATESKPSGELDPLGSYLEELEESGGAAATRSDAGGAEADSFETMDDPIAASTEEIPVAGVKSYGGLTDRMPGARTEGREGRNFEGPERKSQTNLRSHGEDPRRQQGGRPFDKQANRPPNAQRPDQDRKPHQQQQQNQRKDPRADMQGRGQRPDGGNRPPQQQQPQQQKQAAPREHREAPTRLCGWLVSFTDPVGAALELREGKFFVTATSLKPSDLIIEDASISTPHALFAVNSKLGIQVQDLMSERGVLVKRHGTENFEKTETAVPLHHGDSIKFGEVEFLVSVVPGVGEKR